MGLSYLQTGNEAAARKWLEKAAEIANSEVLKSSYQNKMERLIGAQ